MSWKISRISSTLMGLMRDTQSTLQASEPLEAIRSQMLDCMSEYLKGAASERPVWSKVEFADDIQTLWYLRSDLMHLLCDHCGETIANFKVQEITELFRGHMPAAQFASSRRRG